MDPLKVDFAQRALLLRGDRVLLVQRDVEDRNHAFEWELPGGRLEPNETLDSALAREVLEEVGLEVRPQEPLAMWEWSQTSEGSFRTIVAVCRFCDEVEPNQAVSFAGQNQNDNIREYEWVPLRELPKFNLIDKARGPIGRALRQLSLIRPNEWGYLSQSTAIDELCVE